MSQLNQYNFLRWYTGDVNDTTENIPRLGVIDSRCYMPTILQNETVGFFINAEIPFNDSDQENDLALAVLNPYGTVITSIAGVIKKAPDVLGYRLYATFALSGLSDGMYQLGIFKISTSTYKCKSNWLQVVSNSEGTVKVRYRNSRDAYYYNYNALPDFYNAIRLSFSLAAYTNEQQTDQIQDVASGRRRNLTSTGDKSYRIQTYYFDDGAHSGMSAMVEHDYIELNDRAYIQKSAYNPNVRLNSTVSIGEAELFLQSASMVNKYGQLPQLVQNNGTFAVVNNNSKAFYLRTYSINDVQVGSVTVPANSGQYVNFSDLPFGGYVQIESSDGAAYFTTAGYTQPGGNVYRERGGGTAPHVRTYKNDLYNVSKFALIEA